MTPQTSDQNSANRSSLHLWIAIALALVLLISWLMGYGPGGSKCAPTQSMAASTAATMTTLPAAVPAPAIASAPAIAPASAPELAAAPAPPPTPAPGPAPVPATAPAPEASAAPSTLSSAVPVAKIYFGSEKATLPKGGTRSLAGIVKYLKANPGAKASVSGFHDASGNLANNQKLALRRAQAVANALEKLGVNKDRIILQKPAQTTGTGKSQEARRVEVGVVAS